ncbi:hypothetical protein AMECASPLE_028432 [Ameca splendens]|uniref:Uncharacterized protein n=1 Tax=Ameca splendens TaxID=208324 RepID=A0ABV0ZQC8_9TELE
MAYVFPPYLSDKGQICGFHSQWFSCQQILLDERCMFAPPPELPWGSWLVLLFMLSFPGLSALNFSPTLFLSCLMWPLVLVCLPVLSNKPLMSSQDGHICS